MAEIEGDRAGLDLQKVKLTQTVDASVAFCEPAIRTG